MADEMLDIMQAIELALQEELEAAKFYAAAKGKVKDERAISMLDQLVRFEQFHYKKLMDLKISLEKDGKFTAYEGMDFILPDSLIRTSGKIDENRDDILDILGIAIKNEENAKQRYLELAEKTQIPQGKAMFSRLALEEEVHWKLLSDEFYHITNYGMWGI